LEDKDKRVQDDGSFETKWKDDTTEEWELTGVYTITAEFEDLSASTTFYFTGTDGPLPPSVMQQGMNIPGIPAAVQSEQEPQINIMESGKSTSTYGKQGYSISGKSSGTFLTSINSENVCGLSLCSEKLSMQQRIDLYLKTLEFK